MADEDAFLQQMREDGTFDWMRKVAGKATEETPEESDTDPPAEEVEEEASEVTDETPEEASEEPEEEVAEEEDDGYLVLDMTPETEALLRKYGGDINKALKAAVEGQSLIGRQGSELGDLRKQNEQIMVELQAIREQGNRPQLQWPDEDDEPEDAVLKLQQIADNAFYREDLDTFVQAYESWKEIDPLGANAYGLLKQTEAKVLGVDKTAKLREPTLEEGMAALAKKFPQLNEKAFQDELGAELQKWPSLGRLLRGEIPGTTPVERVAALEELAGRVAGRQTDETSRQALRRVAVKTSEEAAQAKREARIASDSKRGRHEEKDEDVRINLGKTKRTLNITQAQKDLEQIFGHPVQIGEEGT